MKRPMRKCDIRQSALGSAAKSASADRRKPMPKWRQQRHRVDRSGRSRSQIEWRILPDGFAEEKVAEKCLPADGGIWKEDDGQSLDQAEVFEPGGGFRGLSRAREAGKQWAVIRRGDIGFAGQVPDPCFGRAREPDRSDSRSFDRRGRGHGQPASSHPLAAGSLWARLSRRQNDVGD